MVSELSFGINKEVLKMRLIVIILAALIAGCGDSKNYRDAISEVNSYIQENYEDSPVFPSLLMYDAPKDGRYEPEKLIQFLNKFKNSTEVSCDELRSALAMPVRNEFDKKDKEKAVGNASDLCWSRIQKEQSNLMRSKNGFRLIYDLSVREYDFDAVGFKACFDDGTTILNRYKEGGKYSEMSNKERVEERVYEVILMPDYKKFRLLGAMAVGFDYWLPVIDGESVDDEIHLQKKPIVTVLSERECLIYPYPQEQARQVTDRIKGKKVQLEILIRTGFTQMSSGFSYGKTEFERRLNPEVQILKVRPVAYRLLLENEPQTRWVEVVDKK